MEKRFWFDEELNPGPQDGMRDCYQLSYCDTDNKKAVGSYIYISKTEGHVQIQPYQLNMHAQIKKRSLVTLTCHLRFNKFGSV